MNSNYVDLSCLCQPVLLLASPGDEHILLLAATGLLRLLRPFRWQHAYLPLMQVNLRSVVKEFLKNQKPFLIGTYHDALSQELNDVGISAQDRLSMTRKKKNPSKAFHEYLNLNSNDLMKLSIGCLLLSDITIADLDCCAVYPGRKMQFAAKCTMSELLVPESFAATLSTLLNDSIPKGCPCSDVLKPPIPVRYRYSMVQILKKVRERMEAEASILASRSKSDSSFRISQAAKKGIVKKGLNAGHARTGNTPASSTVSFPLSHGQFLDSDVASSAGDALSEAMSSVMVSLLKSLFLFTKEQGSNGSGMQNAQDDDVIFIKTSKTMNDTAALAAVSSSDSKQVQNDGSSWMFISNLTFDCDGFVNFAKDDVRPFLRYLLTTEAFKVCQDLTI